MGTLDEAIREHLELKRKHGAGDDEIREAEAEAFGPGEDDAVPGASVTAPAGEGDQLDKVFAATRQEEELPSGEAADEAATTVIPPAEVAEAVVTEGSAVEEVEVKEAVPEEVEAPAMEAPIEAPAEPEPEPEPAPKEGDAGDALEAERANLTGHPTENYDVDAAIAEEEELDILSESRLSDELDRALGTSEQDLSGGLGGSTPSEGNPVAPLPEPPDESNFAPEPDLPPEPPVPEPTPEPDLPPEPAAGALPEDSPLEETPDFLEDSPASDELWFEQREPKDFDFGD